MYAISFGKSVFNWSLEKSFYLGILLSALAVSIALYYFQLSKLHDVKKVQIKQEVHFITNEMDKSSTSYKEMLDFISKRIIEKNLINDPNAISLLLKNVYLTTKGTNTKIGFSDISWHNAANNMAINRYGSIQPITTLPLDLENNLKTFPNTIHLYVIENSAKIPSVKELYFARGITNSKGAYIGKLVVLLDIEPWMNLLKERLDKIADVMAIIDNKQEIFFSTDRQLENLVISLPLKLKGEQVNLIYKDYKFLDYIKFSQSPYAMLYGYNNKVFSQRVVKNITPALITLWMLTFLFLSVFSFFSKKLRLNIRGEFIQDIEILTDEYSKLIKEKATIVADFSKESNIYKTTSEYDKNLLSFYKISYKEKEKLTLNINSNIANSLVEIREFVKVLIQAQTGVIDIPIVYDKQIEILTDIHNKLVYISDFCVVFKEEDIDVATVICDVIRIYAKDIFLNNLSINPKISSKIKTIKFNTLLFQQIIVSLLHVSIECSRPGGEIKIEAIKNKYNLIITIKDDGFHVSEDYKGELETNKHSPLQLDLHTIKSVIETHNGNLEIKYTKEGKVSYLTLPLNPSTTKDKKSVIGGGNVVLFKRL